MQTRRFFLVTASAAALSSCAPRAAITVVPEALRIGTTRDIFVATTRAPGSDGEPGTSRSFGTSFSKYTVSIPPQHEPGEIELAGRSGPNPEEDFAVAETKQYRSAAMFRSELSSALRAVPGRSRAAVIYVHGFNNTFADGLYRIAQIGHDLKIPSVSVHYSWPSAAKPLNYAYDRDSALFARDGLVQLLDEVRAAGAREITLVAHSMGALLAMEAIRQIEIAQPGRAHRLLQGVALFSPDIDVELFRSQALRIRRLPDPFVIFTSRRDRALALSARLTGQRQRLGNLVDYRAIADLKVIVLDVSAFSAGFDNHFTAIQSPTLQKIFSNVGAVDFALGRDQSGRAGLFPGTVLTLQNATAIILSPVTASSL